VDRLSQERLARLVLERLIDSGALRSVASQRALALRMHYLPPCVRIQLPPEGAYLPLLDPGKREAAVQGLADAILRVVTHEEADHWVVSDPQLILDVTLREGSQRVAARPDYEPGLGQDQAQRTLLGEPRVKLTSGEVSVLFRAKQGILPVDLGPWTPRLVLFEESPVEGAVASLYASGPVDEWREGGRIRHKARTRIPVTGDLELTIHGGWSRPWRRTTRCHVSVLGLARMSRPPLQLESSAGESQRWIRTEQPRLEIGPDMVIHTEEHDRLRVENRSKIEASIRWYDDTPMTIPPQGTVTIQGAHFLGLTTPGGVVWRVTLADGAIAPPPRVLTLKGAMAPEVPQSTATERDALFGFERIAAAVHQDAVVLPAVQVGEVDVLVKRHSATGPLALVAMDDCPGVKVRRVRPQTGEAYGAWQQVTDVLELSPSTARLEAIGEPQVLFERPRDLGRLTTDPSDRLHIGPWHLGLTGDGLTVEGEANGPGATLVIDGERVGASARLAYRPAYRVRAGDGLYRIVRE
jgi:hypothetical protein